MRFDQETNAMDQGMFSLNYDDVKIMIFNDLRD